MKIGLFMPTVNNGFIMSEAAPQYRPDFEYVKDVVLKAEHYGMDFALSLVKYKGFGGKTDHWHWALDSLTTVTALAAVTSRIKLIGSVGLLAQAPAQLAKQAANIQMVAGGRFWLNVVTGWQRAEYESMGLWRGDQHTIDRYDYADEYIAVCQQLWQTGESDFKGQYFRMDHAQLAPTPPEPITIVCAGSSDRGMRWTAEHGNYNFIFGTSVEALRETNQKLLAAGDKAGREVKSIASIHCILGDTDAEAEAKVQSYYEGADLEALAFMSGQTQFDPEGATASILQDLRRATFMGAEVLWGSPDTIAEKLSAYSDIEGLEGLMVCLGDPHADIDRFGQEVMPRFGATAVTAP